MKRLIFTLIMAALMSALVNAQVQKPSKAINLDLNKFAGKWYEIVYLQDENVNEDNLTGVSVTYVLTGANKFYEDFSAQKKKNGKPVTATTKLTYQGNGVIKAPGGFKCQVLALDPNYEYVMLGTADLKYVWILSRKQQLDVAVYSNLLDQAAAMGFVTEQVGLTAGR